MSKKTQHATICFLVEKDKVLLAMKKRGHGEGWWNGIGGKIGPEEKAVEAARRETLEEIGVEIKSIKKVAEVNFDYIKKRKREWIGHVFIVEEWKGKPTETEEMKPRWFSKEKIPYDKMWDADIKWIPEILKGKKIIAKLTFNDDDKMVNYVIKEVKGFK